MADSTLGKTGESPPVTTGKDKRTLGPSDTTDSGSDLVGSGQLDSHEDSTSDSHNTGEEWGEVRAVEGSPGTDIEPDKIINTDEDEIAADETELSDVAGDQVDDVSDPRDEGLDSEDDRAG